MNKALVFIGSVTLAATISAPVYASSVKCNNYLSSTARMLCTQTQGKLNQAKKSFKGQFPTAQGGAQAGSKSEFGQFQSSPPQQPNSNSNTNTNNNDNSNSNQQNNQVHIRYN